MQADTFTTGRQALLVEIVGPAGAGKTSLLRVLRRRDSSVRAVSSFRSAAYLPLFIGHGLRVLTLLAHRYGRGRRPCWREIRLTTHLLALPHFLCGPLAAGAAVTVVDQGPIYMLARLREDGWDTLNDVKKAELHNRLLAAWAARLHIIIWLDAPDDVLLRRIEGREKRHAVKGAPPDAARAYLARFRRLYHETLAEVTARADPVLLRFDTGCAPVEQVAEDVLTLLAAARRRSQS